jgi:hypothetical protein
MSFAGRDIVGAEAEPRPVDRNGCTSAEAVRFPGVSESRTAGRILANVAAIYLCFWKPVSVDDLDSLHRLLQQFALRAVSPVRIPTRLADGSFLAGIYVKLSEIL